MAWAALLTAVTLAVTLTGGHGYTDDRQLYHIGVGIGDITGPAAGIIMMGYANPEMKNAGIHTRLFARAYVVCDDIGAEQSGKCVAFVNLDAGMTSQIVKMEVVRRLQQEIGAVFSDANVLLTATHTHSGPAGYLQYVLFQISNLGWVQQSFDCQVDGIVQAIKQAYGDLSAGYMQWTRGELLDASINRSPTAYLNNPQQERDRYEHNTDKEMFLIKIFNADDSPKGMVNWYAVHGTSMNNTNKYISGDNKGLAEQKFESMMDPGSMPGKGKFVAAFVSSNLGDVSPNTNGPMCIDTGLPCDLETSTCGGKVETCIASGPGKDMVDSCRIIGMKQFNFANQLYRDKTNRVVTGKVDFIHQYIDMSNQKVTFRGPDGNLRQEKTCKAAMGFSFAAGTTDGPGAFDFSQSDTTGNMFWKTIRDLIKTPSAEMVQCHQPKPILLPTGEISFPYDWQPHVVPVQLLRVGDIVIIGMPGELTTMAGRRIREAVAKRFADAGETVQVVISGLANTYSDYVTTYEEYQKQRYEGASTVYGPHTHAAYMQKFQQLADYMIQGETLPDEAVPPNMLPNQMTFVAPVIFDSAPAGSDFGDVTQQPPSSVAPGDTVTVKFVSGHPRNNPMQGASFMEVLKLNNGTWDVVATDASWDTFFRWQRTNVFLGRSEATCIWNIPADAEPGTYKIRHMGYRKRLFSTMHKIARKATGWFNRILRRKSRTVIKKTEYYQGDSSPFLVSASGGRSRRRPYFLTRYHRS